MNARIIKALQAQLDQLREAIAAGLDKTGELLSEAVRVQAEIRMRGGAA